MENEKKTTYLAAILGFILLIILFSWFAFGRNKVVSPVPDEGIKVIFTSSPPAGGPSPTSELTPTPSATSSPTPKPTVKATVKPTVTPKPSATPSPSPTTSPSPTP